MHQVPFVYHVPFQNPGTDPQNDNCKILNKKYEEKDKVKKYNIYYCTSAISKDLTHQRCLLNEQGQG